MKSHLYLPALFAIFAAAGSLRAADSVRMSSIFDADWRFNKADVPGSDATALDDSAWTKLNVPHDWAIDGPFLQDAITRGSGAFAPSGVVWYRKSFATPASAATKRTFITFDGVMQNSQVFINGTLLGKRPYGYITFQYDLTDHLKKDGTPNVIAVRADTAQQPASRWYNGGGIYRHVHLTLTDPVHIDNWGTFVTTPAVTAQSATVHVTSTFINQSAAPRDVSLQVTLLDPDGKPAGTAETAPQSVPAGKTLDFNQDLTLSNPKLWDAEHPQLYTAVAAVRSAGATLDDQSVPIGVRSAVFTSDKGFVINGTSVKLKGVCLHVEAGGLGIAVPQDEWIHRLTALKSFGCNAVRTAHNPPSPEFLDACDKVGVYVMDENFDCWLTGKNTYDYHLSFAEWSDIDTRDMVKRDRNHPSIVIYSTGNEIREPKAAGRAPPILTKLLKDFHETDPTRPVTQAILQPNSDPNGGSYNNGYADMLDVVGTNYRDQELLQAWRDKPTRKIVGTENNKDNGAWAAVRDNPQYSGSFIWTGVDYLGETSVFPSIGNPAGFLDITDRPKVEAYSRGSWWSDTPVVFMTHTGGGGGRGAGAAPAAADAPADGVAIPGADAAENFDLIALGDDDSTTVFIAAPAGPAPGGAPAAGAGGRAGGRGARGGAAGGAARGGAGRGAAGAGGTGADWTPANLAPHQETVNINSNCDEVELFLNNASLGSKPRGRIDSVRTWQVAFAPGTLKAVGKNKGAIVATQEFTTAGPAAKITLTPVVKSPLYNDFDSMSYVTVAVTDDKGVMIPAASNTIKFSISGPGKITALATGQLVVQNFHAPEHAAWNGELSAYVQATGDSGPITLSATADGLAPASLTFQTAPARPGH
ncbi:MAG TPA: glycoside hydrolase family 2 TIM barrel-domain containing protein [Phycisphaerae bacterium]